MSKKTILLSLLTAVLVLGLLTGCSGTKELTVEISGTPPASQSWKLVDAASKAAIAYDTLQFKGQTVVKTSIMSGFVTSVYLAFDEDQLTVDGGTTTYNGGTGITGGSRWKYTLQDGVLNILE